MKYSLVIIVGLIATSCFCQIETPKKKPAPAENSTTSYYLGAGRNNSFRLLETNAEPFGKPLGNRENETKLKLWSYEVGMRSQIKKHIQLDGGVAFERFGEQYSSTGTVESGADTSFSYKTRYSYISVPLQVYGTVGEEFKLYAGGGIVPGISYAYKQELTRVDSLGSSNTVKTNNPEKLNSFLLSARVSAGLQWQWTGKLGIYMNYTYLFGLNSTYNDQNAYKHYARYGCLRFGLTFTM